VALPCGHALCVQDFKRIGGNFLVPRRLKSVGNSARVIMHSIVESFQEIDLSQNVRSTGSGSADYQHDSDTQNAQNLEETTALDNVRHISNSSTEPSVEIDFGDVLEELRGSITPHSEMHHLGGVNDTPGRYALTHPEEVNAVDERISGNINVESFVELDFSELLDELRSNEFIPRNHILHTRNDQIPNNVELPFHENVATLGDFFNLYELRRNILHLLELGRLNDGSSAQQISSNPDLLSYSLSSTPSEIIHIQRLQRSITEYLGFNQNSNTSRNIDEQISSTPAQSSHPNRMTLDEYFNSREQSDLAQYNECHSTFDDIDSLASLRAIIQSTDTRISNSDTTNPNDNHE
jgi:hypothetical protein